MELHDQVHFLHGTNNTEKLKETSALSVMCLHGTTFLSATSNHNLSFLLANFLSFRSKDGLQSQCSCSLVSYTKPRHILYQILIMQHSTARHTVEGCANYISFLCIKNLMAMCHALAPIEGPDMLFCNIFKTYAFVIPLSIGVTNCLYYHH
jgi:hypothetical protein